MDVGLSTQHVRHFSAVAHVGRALDEADVNGVEVAGIVVVGIVAAILVLVACVCGVVYCVTRSAGTAIRQRHDTGVRSSTRTTIVAIEPPKEIRVAQLVKEEPVEHSV